MRHTVFITGAAAGLGAATAEEFADHGWQVFAAGHVAPGASAHGIPITPDVTDSDSCAAAAREVAAHTDGLGAVINVAGVLDLGPLMEVSEERLQRIFEVNVIGTQRVNRAMFDLVRAGGGRHRLSASSSAPDGRKPQDRHHKSGSIERSSAGVADRSRGVVQEAGWGMKRLNGLDAMLLYSETPNLHTHALKVTIVNAADFDGEFNFDVFRETFQRRLRVLDPLRYKLVDIPWRLHRPMWLENCEVDLDYHLRRVQVPSPGGRRELDQVIGEIASTPLDRSRPLWEFHFAEGMADDRFALIGKVHHALADGLASANLLARMIELTPPSPDERDHASAPPSKAELLRAAGRDHVQQVAALPGLIRDAARGLSRVRRRSRERPDNPDMAKIFKTPPTFLNHVVSPVRTFATAALSLAEVKETAKHLGVTFNDIVLAMAAGGLRELLLRYDGRADRPILATVMVGTERSPDRISGNEISGMIVSMPVHIDDPLERVRLTSFATARAKEDHDLLGPHLQGRMMDYLPPAVAPAMFRRQSTHAQNKVMNVAVSNVPGPRERGHFGGAPVTEFYSVGILSAGSALNITVWSYVDQVDISVLSDDRTFNDVHEATDALMQGFAEIRQAAGLPGDLTDVGTAMAPARAAG